MRLVDNAAPTKKTTSSYQKFAAICEKRPQARRLRPGPAMWECGVVSGYGRAAPAAPEEDDAQVNRLDRSLISSLPLFAGMAADELDRILGAARSLRFSAGSVIFEQEGEASSFFLLLDGHVRVLKTTPEGQQVTVRYIVPGELMGIAHALGRDTYPATALAVIDCVALSWPGAAWAQFAAAFPSFGANTYKTVGERFQDTQMQVVEMATKQVEQRVAHALLRLIGQRGRKTDEGIAVDFPISRQDIAEMTGTTLHTVSRLLTAWEEKGLVKGGRRKVTVVEPHRLMVLAEGRAG
jgi:CRP-like cAMP-binding protein